MRWPLACLEPGGVAPQARKFAGVALLTGLVIAWTTLMVSPELNWSADFRVNVWEPGRALLDGDSPYQNGRWVSEGGTVYPPASTLLGLPFAAMPYGVGVALWLALLLASVFVALWLCGVRDWRVAALAVASPPVVGGLAYANVSLLLMLALAAIWAWRHHSYRAGIVLGLAIAAKLFLLPVIAWLVFTRRVRDALAAALTAGAVSLAGALVVGPHRTAEFIDVVERNTRDYYANGVGITAFIANLGAPMRTATGLAFAAGVGALALAWTRRTDDLACFTWCVLAAVLSSPLVWSHYFALTLVPLAIAAPALSRVWLYPYITFPQLSYTSAIGGRLLDAGTGIAFSLLVARRATESEQDLHRPRHATSTLEQAASHV